jgi:hypothetical protein
MLLQLLLLKRVNDIKRDIEDWDADAVGTALAIGFFVLWIFWIPSIFWWMTRLGVPRFLTIPLGILATAAVLLWSWPFYVFWGLVFALVIGLLFTIGLGILAAKIDR